VRLRTETLPNASDLAREMFVTALEGGADDFDVFAIDVIWAPEFARAGWLADLSAEFPDLKLALDGTQHQFAFHVERTPVGGFSIHSADPNTDVVHAATEQDLQTHVLEKILNAAGKSILPQLAQAIAAQGKLANVNVVVKKTSFKMNPGKPALPPIAGQNTAMQTPAPDGTSFTNATNVLLDGSPITPEPSNFGKLFRLLPALLLLGALIYFLLHRA